MVRAQRGVRFRVNVGVTGVVLKVGLGQQRVLQLDAPLLNHLNLRLVHLEADRLNVLGLLVVLLQAPALAVVVAAAADKKRPTLGR